MKEEALKLADDLWKKYLDNNECQHGYALSSGCPNDDCQEQSLYEASAMIRRLVKELDKQHLQAYMDGILEGKGSQAFESDMLKPQTKPLSDEEIIDIWFEIGNAKNLKWQQINFARAIEERHGIKK